MEYNDDVPYDVNNVYVNMYMGNIIMYNKIFNDGI